MDIDIDKDKEELYGDRADIPRQWPGGSPTSETTPITYTETFRPSDLVAHKAKRLSSSSEKVPFTNSHALALTSPKKNPKHFPINTAMGVDELSLDSAAPIPQKSRLSNTTLPKRAATRAKMPPKKKTKTAPAKGRTQKKAKEDVFNDAEKLIGSTKSPLYEADLNLVALIQNPDSQDCLASTAIGYPFEDASSNDLARASSEMKNDGLSGRHDEDWLKQSLEASSRRARGDFDDLQNEKFREVWGDSSEGQSDSGDEPENERMLPEHAAGTQCDRDSYGQDGGIGYGDARTLSEGGVQCMTKVQSESQIEFQEEKEARRKEEETCDTMEYYGYDHTWRASNYRHTTTSGLNMRTFPEPEAQGQLTPVGTYHREFLISNDAVGTSYQGSSQHTSSSPNPASFNPYQIGLAPDPNSPLYATWNGVPRPQRGQIQYISSNSKFELMFRNGFIGWSFPFPVIQIGDKIVLSTCDGSYKEALITGWYGTSNRINKPKFVQIAVPPGAHPTSDPLRPDILFPNPNQQKALTGPYRICASMLSCNPTLPNVKKHAGWNELHVFRNGEDLGSMMDLRQAWNFGYNENLFYRQLIFSGTRERRMSPEKKNDGYLFIGYHTLCRKIKRDEFHLCNKGLVLDLGQALNDALAACAEDGYMILPMDNRLLINDGIPGNYHGSLEHIYQHGPVSFPTRYTRELAGSSGWSSGHAHVGPLGLGKGIDLTNRYQWSRGKGKPSLSAQNTFEPAMDQFFDDANVNVETGPRGCLWNEEEIEAAELFFEANVVGHIRHYPVPRNLGDRHFDVHPQQLRLKSSWSVSSPLDKFDLSNWESDPFDRSNVLPPTLTSSVPPIPQPRRRRRLPQQAPAPRLRRRRAVQVDSESPQPEARAVRGDSELLELLQASLGYGISSGQDSMTDSAEDGTMLEQHPTGQDLSNDSFFGGIGQISSYSNPYDYSRFYPNSDAGGIIGPEDPEISNTFFGMDGAGDEEQTMSSQFSRPALKMNMQNTSFGEYSGISQKGTLPVHTSTIDPMLETNLSANSSSPAQHSLNPISQITCAINSQVSISTAKGEGTVYNKQFSELREASSRALLWGQENIEGFCDLDGKSKGEFQDRLASFEKQVQYSASADVIVNPRKKRKAADTEQTSNGQDQDVLHAGAVLQPPTPQQSLGIPSQLTQFSNECFGTQNFDSHAPKRSRMSKQGRSRYQPNGSKMLLDPAEY